VTNGVADSPPSLERISTLVEEGAFEETLAALELVVDHLERGRLTMDESIAWYEAGLGLMRRCSQLLEQAELRISALDADNPARAGSDRTTSGDDSWDADAS
jgi:exodeoxyribonuclease VII small subunit